MAHKVKRQSGSAQWLYRAERFLFWAGTVCLIAALFFSLRAGSNYWADLALRGPFHSSWIRWTAFTSIVVFVIGAVPSGILLLMSRMLRWGLWLKEENSAQSELIARLLQDHYARESEVHLMELDADDETMFVPPTISRR